MTWIEKRNIEIKAQIKLIDHLLTALCKCELTKDGRIYLRKLKSKLKNKLR